MNAASKAIRQLAEDAGEIEDLAVARPEQHRNQGENHEASRTRKGKPPFAFRQTLAVIRH